MKLNSVASDVVGLRLRLANAQGRRACGVWGKGDVGVLWNWLSVLAVLGRLPACLGA